LRSGARGAVGSRLAARLREAGAKLLVADINSSHVEAAVASFGAIPVSAARCHAVDADVFSPCALGAVLTAAAISELRAPVVAGGANNQLDTDIDGERLASRGVLYAPDFIINAGGVISTALEGPGFDPGELLRRVDGIAETLKAIFERSDAEGSPTNRVADRMAKERLSAMRRR
jgi:leucine dehydrogenase